LTAMLDPRCDTGSERGEEHDENAVSTPAELLVEQVLRELLDSSTSALARYEHALRLLRGL